MFTGPKLERGIDEKESGSANDFRVIKEVEIYGSIPENEETFLNGDNNYTPSFEKEGEVSELGSSYGLGLYKQNEKFYFSTCNTDVKEQKAFLIPENVANQILENLKLGSNKNTAVNKLVDSLWSSNIDIQSTLEKISKELS